MIYQEYFIRRNFLKIGIKFSNFIYEEYQFNGGVFVFYVYMDEFLFLFLMEMERFFEEFFVLIFSENEKNVVYYVLVIVYGVVVYFLDFLDYFVFNFFNILVKMEILGKKDIEIIIILNFYIQVR